MSESDKLICWSCGQRTSPGICNHCQAEVSDPKDAFVETDEDREKERKLVYQISYQDKNYYLDYEDLRSTVEESFTIDKITLENPAKKSKEPKFIATDFTGSSYKSSFNQLKNQTSELLPGLYPTVKENEENYEISFIFTRKEGLYSYTILAILFIFTLISTIAAGIYDFSKIQAALGNSLPGLSIYEVSISLNSLIWSIQFTIAIFFILMIKDIPYVLDFFLLKKGEFSIFYIPAPPVFELGTLSNIIHQRSVHENSNSILQKTLFGPILGWIVSIAIIISTLSLSVHNPNAASIYGNHSVLANTKFEPLMLSFIVDIAQYFDIFDPQTSEFLTQSFILHPFTLAGIAGLYICGIQLLPLSHFNGGFNTFAVLGQTPHLILSYLVLFAFFGVHWLLVIYLFLINEFLPNPVMLDRVTDPQLFYKIIYGVTIIIALLSFPIPIDWIII